MYTHVSICVYLCLYLCVRLHVWMVPHTPAILHWSPTMHSKRLEPHDAFESTYAHVCVSVSECVCM